MMHYELVCSDQSTAGLIGMTLEFAILIAELSTGQYFTIDCSLIVN